MPTPGDHRYFPSTAVFLCEVLKLCVSLALAVHGAARRNLAAPPSPSTSPRSPSPSGAIFREIFETVFSPDSWRLAIPAALYTVQNTLLYAAVGNLEAVHYQVLYQLKILTTALFSVFLLRRPLPMHRWAALLLLTLGISVVSLAPASPNQSRGTMALQDTDDHFFPRSAHELAAGVGVVRGITRRAIDAIAGGDGGDVMRRSATYQGIGEDEFGEGMNYAVGLTAVLTAAAVSGLAGVFLESVLKSSPSATSTAKSPSPHANIWTRNSQLAFYSIFAALFGIMWQDGAEIAEHGFFDGYTWVVWAVVVFQACDGLLASLCIQYADNIAKNFATSFSIVLSFLFSVLFFDFSTSFAFLLGTSLVLGSAYLYSMTGPHVHSPLRLAQRTPRPAPLRISSSYQHLHHGRSPPPPATGTLTPTRAASLMRLSPVAPGTPRTAEEGGTGADGCGSGGGGSGYLGVEAYEFRSIGLSTSRPSSPMIPQRGAWGKRDD